MEHYRAGAYRHALQYLDELVARCAERGVNALPSVGEMAALAGVSRVTMHKAVSALKAAGTLLVRPRKGIFLSRPTPVPDTGPLQNRTAEQAHATRAKRIADTVTAQILSLEYRPGTMLPSYKLLCDTYHTSYHTMRKVMQSLCRRGLVVAHGRRFRVRPVRRETSRSTVVVIASTDNMDVVASLSPRMPELWHALSRECFKRNVRTELYGRLKAMGAAPWSDGARMPLTVRDRDRMVLGYIVLTLGTAMPGLRELVHLLEQTGRRVAIVHENAQLAFAEVAALARHSRSVRVFETAATGRCGVDVGNYLIRCGHRRIAMFHAPLLDVRWRKRREGVERAFREAGYDGAVALFCPANIQTGRDLSQRLTTRVESAVLSELADRVAELYKPAHNFYESSLRPPGIGDHFLRGATLPVLMLPVFEKALARNDISAWVGANDEFALLALSFARKRGVSLPDRLSIVGFDNSHTSIGQGMSSYDFNTPALVHRAVGYLAGDEPVRSDDAVVEVPGHVIERSSSGPVGQC